MDTKKIDTIIHLLFQGIYSGDNDRDVLKLLKSGDFDALSEEQKVQVLREREPENIDDCGRQKCPPSERVVDSNNNGLLNFILRLNRVRCLETVLQFLPLYSVYKREGNTHNTGKKRKDAREILYAHKAVWEVTEAASEEDEKENAKNVTGETNEENEEAYKSSGTPEKSGEPDTICSVKTEAFTMLAAELFIIGYNHNANECTHFLVEQAPGLVDVKVQGKLALASALMSDGYTCRTLLFLVKHGAVIGDMDPCAELTKLYTRGFTHPKECSFRISLPFCPVCSECPLKTTLLIKGNEDKIKNYKDQNGNTLLHILTSQLKSPDTEHHTIYFCVESVLAVGIDPTCVNNAGQSVFHILLHAIKHTAQDEYRTEVLFKCMELLAPLCQGMKIKDEELLENLFAVCDSLYDPAIIEKWIGIYKLIFQHDVMDAEFVVSSGRTPWQLVLKGGELCNSYMQCTVCEQLSELCNLAIQRGCDLDRYIDVTSRAEVLSTAGLIYEPTTVTETAIIWQHEGHPVNYCCYLSLLKLLIENGVDITRLVMPSVPNAYAIVFNEMISDRRWDNKGHQYHGYLRQNLSLEEMYNICKTLLSHFPRCSEKLISWLIWSTDGPQDARRERIKQLLLLGRSLKFLSKRAILRSVQHKRQIESLPLPPALTTYLMEGKGEQD